MKRSLSLIAAIAGLLAAACEAKAGGRTDHLFTVETKSPGTVAAGGKATAEIQIKVKPEGHISEEAPLKVKLAPKNAQVAKDKLAKSDATYKDGGASVPVPFTAGADKGAASIDADVSFYICAKEICEKHDRKVSIPVTVQ